MGSVTDKGTGNDFSDDFCFHLLVPGSHPAGSPSQARTCWPRVTGWLASMSKKGKLELDLPERVAFCNQSCSGTVPGAVRHQHGGGGRIRHGRPDADGRRQPEPGYGEGAADALGPQDPRWRDRGGCGRAGISQQR